MLKAMRSLKPAHTTSSHVLHLCLAVLVLVVELWLLLALIVRDVGRLASVGVPLVIEAEVSLCSILSLRYKQYKEYDDLQCNLQDAHAHHEHVQAVVPFCHFLVVVVRNPEHEP